MAIIIANITCTKINCTRIKRYSLKYINTLSSFLEEVGVDSVEEEGEDEGEEY